MMSENKLQSLSEIFNEKFFRIPDFQRGYAWEELEKRKDELSKTVEHIYPQTPIDGSWKKSC